MWHDKSRVCSAMHWVERSERIGVRDELWRLGQGCGEDSQKQVTVEGKERSTRQETIHDNVVTSNDHIVEGTVQIREVTCYDLFCLFFSVALACAHKWKKIFVECIWMCILPYMRMIYVKVASSLSLSLRNLQKVITTEIVMEIVWVRVNCLPAYLLLHLLHHPRIIINNDDNNNNK